MHKKLLSVLTCLGLLFTTNSAMAWGGPFSTWGKVGDMTLVMAPAYALGLTIAAHDLDGTLQLGESVVAAQLLSEGIKAMKLEERPNHEDKKSFPSGHAAGAFSSAMFVHKRYGFKYAIPPYIMSLVTGYARVRSEAHYWHDVAGGAAISALFTWILVDKYVPEGVSVSADADSVRLGFNTTF